ncbi:unnamed protein product [Cyprideis torosa]|uniref:Glutathione peroxidase n=1 Tax=Cyprideis torosa TaxID=163714 RepID=A0A7R8W8H6_9CRUS|nr:unnamed protein product [Cyprideis torosa]CAG0888586.1 unnamed protein product [Cyprideis torosa]
MLNNLSQRFLPTAIHNSKRAVLGLTAASFVAYFYHSSPAQMASATGESGEGIGNQDWKKAKNVYDFTANDIDKNLVQMSQYKHSEAGLRIAAFPCNQFGGQEPGTNEEIKKFAREKYNATFDLFDKIDVNGKHAHPLFEYLKHKQSGFLINAIKWNFTKFLVDREGIPVKRFGPTDDPNTMEDDILKLLK